MLFRSTTGSGGSFALAGVPSGTYVLMYGRPGELKLAPGEWDGIPVTRGTFCMDNLRNSVCDIEGVDPSLFWSDGALVAEGTISAMAYQDHEKQPGVVSLGSAAAGSAGEQMHIYRGALRSVHAGITAHISGGQYAPQVDVTRGDTVTVRIEVPRE